MSALIYCPFPDRQSAREASTALLDEKLIACANVLGAVESHYVWEGKRDSGEEIGVLFKTDESLLTDAIERLGDLHPYEIPAIIGNVHEIAAVINQCVKLPKACPRALTRFGKISLINTHITVP